LEWNLASKTSVGWVKTEPNQTKKMDEVIILGMASIAF
jgi:hypothetical protein